MGTLIILALFLIIGFVFNKIMKVDPTPQTEPEKAEYSAQESGWSVLEQYNNEVEKATVRELANSERGQNAPPVFRGYNSDNEMFGSMSDNSERVLTDFTPETYVFGESPIYKGLDSSYSQNKDSKNGSFAPGSDYKFGGETYMNEGPLYGEGSSLSKPFIGGEISPLEDMIKSKNKNSQGVKNRVLGQKSASFEDPITSSDILRDGAISAPKIGDFTGATSLSENYTNSKDIASVVANFNFRDAVIFSAILNPKFEEENCPKGEFLI